MKIKTTLIICALTVGAFWQSCSNDLDLNADWQSIPIVYAMLDFQNDNHYVRVQKAFLDPKTNAVELAQVSDSIYYSNISVNLTVNGDQTYTLTKVNGEDEGLDKDQGVFSNTPNILYKIAQSDIGLEPGDTIGLIVNRGDNLPAVTATTSIVGAASMTDPGNDINGNPRPLFFKNGVKEGIRFRGSSFAPVYDLQLRFVYEESLFTNPGQRETFTIVMKIDGQIENDVNSNLPIGPAGIATGIDGIDFFSFVGANIPIKEDYQRFFKRIDVQIAGGSPEILETFNVTNANTGITSAQDIPIYTNLSEGRGLFTSRNIHIDSRGLAVETRDSLANGTYTKDLNFLQ